MNNISDINLSNQKLILLFNKFNIWVETNNFNNIKEKFDSLSNNDKLIIKKLLELYKIKYNYINENNNYLNEIYENIKKESIIIYPNNIKEQNKYKLKNSYLINKILNISNRKSEYIRILIKEKARIKYASMPKEYHRLKKIKKRNNSIRRIGYKEYLKKQREMQLRWYNKLSIERKNIMKEKKKKYWKALILKRKKLI
jgi:hypothetical protein